AGRLADGLGRGGVLMGGYVALAGVYVAILAPAQGTVMVLGSLLLFGTYYACTDGVMSALASGLLPPETRTAGLALLGTSMALAGLAGAALFGARRCCVWGRPAGGGVLLCLAV